MYQLQVEAGHFAFQKADLRIVGPRSGQLLGKAFDFCALVRILPLELFDFLFGHAEEFEGLLVHSHTSCDVVGLVGLVCGRFRRNADVQLLQNPLQQSDHLTLFDELLTFTGAKVFVQKRVDLQKHPMRQLDHREDVRVQIFVSPLLQSDVLLFELSVVLLELGDEL